MRKILLSVCLLLSSIGCHREPWQDEPRDAKGRWISELYSYADKQHITPKIAADAGAEFEQYIFDYAQSHGPALNKKEMADYLTWKKRKQK